MTKIITSVVILFFSTVLLLGWSTNSYAAGSRISDFKATTDPASANPKNFSKTLTFKYTALANDPAVENFKVECGTSTSGSTLLPKDSREFKCTYPKEPVATYKVKLTPLAKGSKAIGDAAELSVTEKETKPPTDTKPADTKPVATGPVPKVFKPYVDAIGDSLTIDNPSNESDVTGIVAKIINWLLLIVAMLSAVMIIYAGLLLIFNGGDESRAAKGKTTLTWAVIGMVVALSAFAIVNIIQGILN